MEFLERTEHRENDEGGAGAYDTMRCDIGGVLLANDNNKNYDKNNSDSTSPEEKKDSTKRGRSRAATRVVVWGRDFHLERLQNSYLSLVRMMQAKPQPQNDMDATLTSPSAAVVVPDESALKQAIQQSKAIIGALLDEAVSVVGLPPVQDPLQPSVLKSYNDTNIFFLVRVTLLWSYPCRITATDQNCHTQDHPKQQTTDAILVRGHATCSLQPMKVHQMHDPIVVSVVVPVNPHPLPSEEQQAADSVVTKEQQEHDKELLPNRFQSSNPHDKVASWCRLRKQLELPTYKPPEAAEVLMVRSRLVSGEDEEEKEDDIKKNHHRQPPRLVVEILEGLSSNFFVIYKDGTLRTATEGVLFGYVRHLVLESAHRVGLTFDPRPIYLHESKQWQECFITSSSRLIWPIAKIMMRPPVVGDATGNSDNPPFVELWKFEANTSASQPPKWHDLFNEVLKAGGYDEMYVA